MINKIDCGTNAYAIYNFIKNKSYKGGYTTVKNFWLFTEFLENREMIGIELE